MALAGFAQQLDELLHLIGRHVPELTYMARLDFDSQAIEQRDSFGGDSHAHGATIIRRPLALNEAAFVQLIEEARDVRGARNELCG